MRSVQPGQMPGAVEVPGGGFDRRKRHSGAAAGQLPRRHDTPSSALVETDRRRVLRDRPGHLRAQCRHRHIHQFQTRGVAAEGDGDALCVEVVRGLHGPIGIDDDRVRPPACGGATGAALDGRLQGPAARCRAVRGGDRRRCRLHIDRISRVPTWGNRPDDSAGPAEPSPPVATGSPHPRAWRRVAALTSRFVGSALAVPGERDVSSG